MKDVKNRLLFQSPLALGSSTPDQCPLCPHAALQKEKLDGKTSLLKQTKKKKKKFKKCFTQQTFPSALGKENDQEHKEEKPKKKRVKREEAGGEGEVVVREAMMEK